MARPGRVRSIEPSELLPNMELKLSKNAWHLELDIVMELFAFNSRTTVALSRGLSLYVEARFLGTTFLSERYSNAYA